MKTIPEHKDKLGRVLQAGDYVAYPEYTRLNIGKIAKLNPKTIAVLNGRWTVNKYSADTIKLDGPELVVYLLKK